MSVRTGAAAGLPQQADIQRLLTTKYRKSLYAPFRRAVETYDLIPPGAKIAVGISGGKDSLLMALLLSQLKMERQGHSDFDLKLIAMDPGYDLENRRNLEANLKTLGLEVEIFESNVFAASLAMSDKTPCYMCARMRRGVLYEKAQSQGCTHLALGHHYDDVIETTLMNVLCAGQFMTMLPKWKSERRENMTLIRPLYLIREEVIKGFFHRIGVVPMACGCSVTKREGDSRRKEIKALIKGLEGTFDNVAHNIFSSAANVNLKYILGTSSSASHSSPDEDAGEGTNHA